MKLDFETNTSNVTFVDNGLVHENATETSSSENVQMLKDGIKAAQDGKRSKARQLLLRVTDVEPENENAWLWLASISEYPEELLIFLTNVLNINPHNERALEWAGATKSLLSKTFVQRGIDASKESHTDFAKQCFLQAIVHDSQNEMAWLWLASVCDSVEEKSTHLQKVLNLNPENETAKTLLENTRNQMAEAKLLKAVSAAVADDHTNAHRLLQEIFKQSAEMEDAWVLKSFLTNSFNDKVACFKKILEINPDNGLAQVSLISLLGIMSKAEPEQPDETLDLREKVVEDSDVNHEEPIEAEYVAEQTNLDVNTFFEDSTDNLVTSVNNETYEQLNVQEKVEEMTDLEKQRLDEAEQIEELNQLVQEFEKENIELDASEFVSSESKMADYSSMTETGSLEIPALQYEPADNQAFFELETADDDEVVAVLPETVEQSYFENNTDEQNVEFDQLQVETEVSFSEETVENFDEEHSSEQDSKLSTMEVSGEEVEVAEFAEVEAENFETHAVMQEDYSDELIEENSSATFEQATDYEEVQEEFYTSEVAAESDYLQETVKETEEVFEETVFSSPVEVQAETQNLVEEDETSSTVENEVAQVETVSDETESEELLQERGFEFYKENHPTQTVAHQQFETEVHQPKQVMNPCPFCKAENDVNAFVCISCRTMLTMSDLEMLLAYQEVNSDMLQEAVERMEVEKKLREFSAEEQRFLAIGYINLKQFRQGLTHLQAASKLNRNDVVLSSQVNALAIRLSEIEQKEAVHDTMLRNRTILVVDDSATVRKLISGKLEKCGHEVICAIDGVDALEKINELVPDLILLDITMPRMDGYQVCKLIRNNDATKDVPIVMISGKDGFFDKVRGRMAGTTGYITKPFGPETLMKTVENYIV